ncbi:YaaC family protein [Streptomyces sp. NPDC052015]|uniref:YaaC family protein n=1 Tax=Streptomyces sp. NPDC052015 TaxID=3154755 RepID=UPI0034254A9A
MSLQEIDAAISSGLPEEQLQDLRDYFGRSRPTRADLRSALFSTITRKYAHQRYLFPAPAGLSESLHPLMAWWAVLYALSMLARYQPAQWAGHINVDDSQHAVPIEKLLERAMGHLPVLIADTIDEVATWT